jgi:hypothetical protein
MWMDTYQNKVYKLSVYVEANEVFDLTGNNSKCISANMLLCLENQ